jgi:hypothetical protein
MRTYGDLHLEMFVKTLKVSTTHDLLCPFEDDLTEVHFHQLGTVSNC